ncbi:hypothetical protein ACXIUS_20505 [Bosea thiooxidans]|jgi:hypothetical protein
MVPQRRFGLAYRASYVRAAFGRHRQGSGRVKARRLAERIRTAVSHIGDEHLFSVLDEEFDELSCEPARLLQMANQP